jgi:predicted secreted protein
VTFRLGFKRMSENGDVAEPLWSEPVTMNVIVPEEMKEVTLPGVAEATSQAPDQSPVTPTEMSETPSVAVPDPAVTSVEMNGMPSSAVAETAAPAGSQALVFQDPGVPIKVPVGQEFSIALASNPSTGFGWKMTLPVDQKTLKFLGSEYVAPQTTMMGAPGQEVYKFKALISGETKADFVYARPWEPKVSPTRKIFTILVQETQ